MDRLEEQVQQFFSNAKRMKVEQRDEQFQKILKVFINYLSITCQFLDINFDEFLI